MGPTGPMGIPNINSSLPPMPVELSWISSADCDHSLKLSWQFGCSDTVQNQQWNSSSWKQWNRPVSGYGHISHSRVGVPVRPFALPHEDANGPADYGNIVVTLTSRFVAQKTLMRVNEARRSQRIVLRFVLFGCIVTHKMPRQDFLVCTSTPRSVFSKEFMQL